MPYIFDSIELGDFYLINVSEYLCPDENNKVSL